MSSSRGGEKRKGSQAENSRRIQSDHQLLVCRDDGDGDAAVGGGNVALLAQDHLLVLLGIDLDPEGFLTVGETIFTIEGGVFKNTGSTDDHVDVAKFAIIHANVIRHALAIHFDCEGGANVSSFIGLFDIASIIGNAADSDESGLVIEDLIDFIRRFSGARHQVRHDGGVDVARSCSHHDAGQRGQAHGSRDTFSVLDCADRGAASDVESDDIGVLFFRQIFFSRDGGKVFVACAVGTIAANRIFLVVFIGERVHILFRLHGLMEGGIEDGNLSDGRGKDFSEGFKARDMSRVVERGERDERSNLLFRLLGEEGGIAKVLSALDDSMSDGSDFLDAGDDPMLDHSIHDQMDGIFVIGNRKRDGLLETTRLFNRENAIFMTDSFHDSRGQHVEMTSFVAKLLFLEGGVIHFIELEFERGRTGIDAHDLVSLGHDNLLKRWIYVF